MKRLPAELPSSGEMSRADARVIASGVAVTALMQRAGEVVAGYVVQITKKFPKGVKNSAINGTVTLLCGAGNNGGDGLVAARFIAEMGFTVNAVLCSEKELSSATQTQLSELDGVSIFQFIGTGIEGESGEMGSPLDLSGLREMVNRSGLVVDALLGTGQREEPRGLLVEALKSLADYKGIILSIDVPTGINPDSGEVFPNAVRATHTICLERVKRGLMQYPGREHCGEIVCESLGIPVSDTDFSLVDPSMIPAPAKRPRDSHKGIFGPVLVLAGSKGMPGAASLVGLAALRAGAGVVHTTSSAATAFAPELIEANFGTFDLADFNGIVVGPGLGTDDAMSKLVEHVLGQRRRTPIVVDADALTIIAASKAYDLLLDTIITPHPGEAARLLGCTVATVQRDRYAAAQELGARTRATVVLKGASTIVYAGASAVSRGVVNMTGTPWMATAGSGDVLAGIIGALTMQGLSRFDAAVAGVALHGVCGEIASGGNHPIIASDLISSIPAAWDQLFV